MTRTILINSKGEEEIDPYNKKGLLDKWLSKIRLSSRNIDYFSFKGISEPASELITKYLLDLYVGKNLAKGTSRGQRSAIHLCNARQRLHRITQMLETESKKPLLELTEDDALMFFNNMRNGIILTKSGSRFIDVGSYAKKFIAFWRWIIRTQKNLNLPNIVESIDTRVEKKPEWIYFTLKQAEEMAETTNDQYYKTLVYFLFDSGVRAPKELMNIRAMDITESGSQHLYLNVREETSKTFGRKIKLMISSEQMRKFLKKTNKKGTDFLFDKNYYTVNRAIAKMGYKILNRGKLIKQTKGKSIVTNGLTMYDFRHNSCCHYLPIYKSENQMKYRYGWKKGEMIHYYSEFIGMRDTITEDDMLIDTTKTQIQQELQKERQKVAILQEQMQAQKNEMEERMKAMEKMMLQRFADNFVKN